MVFLTFAFIATAVLLKWLAFPWLLSPYVRVPSATFSLTLRCVPSEIRIQSLTPYVSLLAAQLDISDLKYHMHMGTYPVSVGSQSAPDGTFVLTPSVYATGKAADQLNQGAATLTVHFSRVPFLDISNVKVSYLSQNASGACLPEELKGNALVSRIEGATPSTMRFALIQDKLSWFLLQANELAGNILLCSLVVAFFWIATWVVWGFSLKYLPARPLMRLITRNNLATLSDSDKRELVSQVRQEYSKVYRRLAFARVVGPASGFLLTVTSLVAALHPSLVAAQDTFHFISSLQLALVATFMGLIIRIAAEFAIRFHREVALRRIDLLPYDGGRGDQE